MIGILLATYNGSAFIRSLLESILTQSYGDFRLYVRDDGSTDDTLAIVREAAKRDDRIHIVDDGRGNQRVVQNFARLMEHALQDGCSAVFFSDQDDVWLPNKVEVGVQELQKLEGQHGTETPLLVHTDLEVVDSELQRVHPSFMQFSGITNNTQHPLQTLLVQNFVTGCTILANRSLLEASLPIPPEAVMHDWWLALCAASLGEIAYIDRPTIKYRQHEDNQVGATSFTYWQALMKRLRGNVSAEERWQLFLDTLHQAAALRRHVIRNNDADSPRLHLLKDFVNAFESSDSKLSRVATLNRIGVPSLPLLRKTLWLRRAMVCGPIGSKAQRPAA